MPALICRTLDGAKPVRKWLYSLPPGDRKAIGVDIAIVECGWPMGMPTRRPLGNGCREIRGNLPSNRSARVSFCIAGDRIVVLHGFIKKTPKTSDCDLTIARSRQKTVQ